MKTMAIKTVIYILFSVSAVFLFIQMYNDSRENYNHRQLQSISAEAIQSDRVRQSLKDVPDWVQTYVAWHKEQRLHHLHDPETKFITVTCHKNYACGGLSDRLRALPYFLLAAHKMQRVLFIHWQKFSLEDFLVPPVGGLDWRLPEEFQDLGDAQPWRQPKCENWDKHRPCNLWDQTDPTYFTKKNIIINAREDLYSEIKDEYFSTPRMQDGSYGAIMNIFFGPSVGVNQQFRETMKKLNLKPRQYLAAHFRDRYPYLPDRTAKMTPIHKHHILHNSIHCVVHKSGQKDLPVYFTSDKVQNLYYLLNESPYAAQNNPPVKVVGIENLNRDNIDEGVDYSIKKPQDFYSVFVDMLIFAHSRCVSYGQGGYGLFGARMADERCMIQHQVVWNATDCPSLL